MSTHRLIQYSLYEHEKASLLLHLIKAEGRRAGLVVFMKTRDGVHEITAQLQREGLHAESIHATKKKDLRTKILADFAGGKLEILVTTTAMGAELGIDADTTVINYDLPDMGEGFVPLTSDPTSSVEVALFVTADNSNLLRKWQGLMTEEIAQVKAEGFAYSTKRPAVTPAKPMKKGYRSKPLQNKKPKLKFKYSGKPMPKAKKPRGSK